MTVWQIAAGSDQRDYVDDFLRYGLAFVGGQRKIDTLALVRPGDLLVLKRGLSQVVAVGRVIDRGTGHYGVGDKHWLRDFDGWDLQAYVHVDWRLPPSELPPDGLLRGTIARIKQDVLREAAIGAFSQGTPTSSPLVEPGSTNPIDDEQMLGFLVTKGLSPRLAEELTAAFARIRRLARYYRVECDRKDVREHETRTFLVAPLLLALGWAEQSMKIELSVPKGRIDLACFRRPYRRDATGQANDSDCELIIETKGLAQGLGLAPEQARSYAAHYPSTRAVVVTNGYCYKVFDKVDGAFSESPSAYMNLLDPRDRYPRDPIRTAGCLAVLEQLLPS